MSRFARVNGTLAFLISLHEWYFIGIMDIIVKKGGEMAKKKKDYETHEASIQSLREFASSKRWQLVEEREIDYGYRVVVFDGFTRNNVDFYPSGKIVIQGIPGAIRDELGRWREERTTAAVLQTGIVSLPFGDMPPIEKPVPVE